MCNGSFESNTSIKIWKLLFSNHLEIWETNLKLLIIIQELTAFQRFWSYESFESYQIQSFEQSIWKVLNEDKEKYYVLGAQNNFMDQKIYVFFREQFIGSNL